MKKRTRFWIIVVVIAATAIFLYTDYVFDRVTCARLVSHEYGVRTASAQARSCLYDLDTVLPWNGYFPW